MKAKKTATGNRTVPVANRVRRGTMKANESRYRSQAYRDAVAKEVYEFELQQIGKRLERLEEKKRRLGL